MGPKEEKVSGMRSM